MFTERALEASGWRAAALHAAARLLLPSRCLACRAESLRLAGRGGVCAGCWEKLPRLDAPRCSVCDEPRASLSREDRPCGRCLLDPPPFDRLSAAAPYRGVARQVLLAFKFGGADYLARHLAAVMAERISADDGFDFVAAVPATPRARRRRDHAADLLARAVAAGRALPFRRRALRKVRETVRQSLLAQARRAANVRSAFRAEIPGGAAVLLVDDVATSGATARECSRALRAAGASRVVVWCFARASRADVDFEPPEESLGPGGPPGAPVSQNGN